MWGKVASATIGLVVLAGCGSSGTKSVRAAAETSHPAAVKVTVSPTPKASPTPAGFNNPNALAADIKKTANEKAAKNGQPGAITGVMCIATATPHQFVCNSTGNDGSSYTVTVTVSADGQSWITSA